MTVGDREVVSDSWSLVRERALTTGLFAQDDILDTRVSAEERSCREGM